MKAKRNGRRPWELSPAELERLTADLDQEFIADKFHKLSAEDRRLWKRAVRKRGRPVQGRGAQVISVSIEKGLLEQADALAKRKRITRAKLIARGLRAVLAAEGLIAS